MYSDYLFYIKEYIYYNIHDIFKKNSSFSFSQTSFKYKIDEEVKLFLSKSNILISNLFIFSDKHLVVLSFRLSLISESDIQLDH